MKQRFTVRSGALDGVETFLAVARHASFRKAAAELAVTPSAVSQTIRALEARLGVPLFLRTTRSVGLTEAGTRFLAEAAPAYDAITAAAHAARSLGTHPSGLLRIAMPRDAMVVVQPLIASFCRAHPSVQLEIAASEPLADLTAHGFDAGIHMGNAIDADMVAIRITPPFRLAIVAAPSYLARHGTPETIADLHRHACLTRRRASGLVPPWHLVEKGIPREVTVTGPLIADYAILLPAAEAGLGLLQIPRPLVRPALQAGTLVQVLPDLAPTTAGLFLYHSGRQQVLPKLRAFIDHMRAADPRAIVAHIAAVA